MSERKIATRDAFFAMASQVKREDVPVPELGEGCVIPVWQFTAREKTEWELSQVFEGPKANRLSVRERLVVAVCRNDDGVSIFTQEDVAKLAKCAVSVIERIVNVAQRLNSVSEEDIAALAKNFEPTNED